MKSVLRAIGCYWFAAILVALIWSTSIESMRERISGTTLVPYLIVWLIAMVPGVLIIFLAEKQA